MPYVERIAKAARRTFIGDRVWSARAELDELYARNELQHRAILGAVAAGSARAAGELAREHVLASGRLIEAVLDIAREPLRNGRGCAAAFLPAHQLRQRAHVRHDRSCAASAGGVAPNPSRSCRRSTQTVLSPSSLAGTWS